MKDSVMEEVKRIFKPEFLNRIDETIVFRALNKEDISDLSAATVDVKDADVSDDPDKLTYGPDCYTPSASYDDAEGKVCDTDVASRDESAFFGDMFY